MLVLTRKANEQILIGDDIKITLVRIRGNSVRVGIEAPRDVRVVRGELKSRDESDSDTELEFDLSDRETVFAHPQPRFGRSPVGSDNKSGSDSSRNPEFVASSDEEGPDSSRIIVGRVRPAADSDKIARAPLADFVSAT